jgi:hypothetical protein
MIDNYAAAALIEDVLTGKVTGREEFHARARKLQIKADSEAAIELHQAGHYLDDADIRARDPEFARLQEEGLREAIRRLRRFDEI